MCSMGKAVALLLLALFVVVQVSATPLQAEDMSDPVGEAGDGEALNKRSVEDAGRPPVKN